MELQRDYKMGHFSPALEIGFGETRPTPRDPRPLRDPGANAIGLKQISYWLWSDPATVEKFIEEGMPLVRTTAQGEPVVSVLAARAWLRGHHPGVGR